MEKRLTAEGRHVYVLDGDNIRHGLNKDLGFTEEARVESHPPRRRSGAADGRCRADRPLLISPFRNERRLAREIAGDISFTEVYVDTPLEVCEARDPKGLYARARRGEIKNFTGIDSPFEAPEHADVVLHGATSSPEEMAEQLYQRLFFGTACIRSRPGPHGSTGSPCGPQRTCCVALMVSLSNHEGVPWSG